MRKIILSLGAGVLGLALTGSADAHPVHYGHEHHGRTVYYRAHGVAFRGGYYFAGRQHDHFTRRVWDVRYHRYIYWEPDLRVYYYWYAPGNCYYPVTYCP